MNLSEFEEIKTEPRSRTRCQMVSSGRPICLGRIRDTNTWKLATHELVPFRHRFSGESILLVRKLQPEGAVS